MFLFYLNVFKIYYLKINKYLFLFNFSCKMLIQLIGKQERGNRYGQIEVPSNVLPGGLLKLTLLNLVICAENHQEHFAEHDQIAYPSNENYNPFIERRIPRPREVQHRRRTIYFAPQINVPTITAEETENSNFRFRRSTSKRFKRNADEMEISIEVQFQHALIQCKEPMSIRAADFSIGETYTNEVIKWFNSKFVLAQRIGFADAYKSHYLLAVSTDPAVTAKTRHNFVELRIPPRSKIVFQGKSGFQFLISMGFSLALHNFEVDENQNYFFENEHYSEIKIETAPREIKAAIILKVNYATCIMKEMERSSDLSDSDLDFNSKSSLVVDFQNLSPEIMFSVVLNEKNILVKNLQYTTNLFSYLLKEIELMLNFRTGYFEVGFETVNNVRRLFFVKKKGSFADSKLSNKISLYFEIGTTLLELLGFPNEAASFNWEPNSTRKMFWNNWIHDAEPIPNIEEFKAFDDLAKIVVKNMHGEFEPLQLLQLQYKQLENNKKTLEAAIERMQRNIEEPIDPELIDAQRLPELAPEPVQEIHEELDEANPIINENVNLEPNVVEDAPEIIEAETEAEVEADAEAEAEAEAEIEADVDAVEAVENELEVVPEEEEVAEIEADIEIEDFNLIQFPNPIPPTQSRFFIPLQKEPRPRCPRPIDFPDFCNIILREGEPIDYIIERGYVSILGILKSQTPRLLSNYCLLRNTGQRISMLQVEFLDSHLNSWFPRPDQEPLFFKIDFLCETIN